MARGRSNSRSQSARGRSPSSRSPVKRSREGPGRPVEVDTIRAEQQRRSAANMKWWKSVKRGLVLFGGSLLLVVFFCVPYGRRGMQHIGAGLWVGVIIFSSGQHPHYIVAFDGWDDVGDPYT